MKNDKKSIKLFSFLPVFWEAGKKFYLNKIWAIKSETWKKELYGKFSDKASANVTNEKNFFEA